MISLKALYRGWNWVGVILLKILKEISTVRFASHRWIWGTECHLEQLMMLHGLQNVNSNYETRKIAPPHVWIKESVGVNYEARKTINCPRVGQRWRKRWSINKSRDPRRRGIGKIEKKYYSNQNCTCNWFNWFIWKLTSSDNEFIQISASCFCLIVL